MPHQKDKKEGKKGKEMNSIYRIIDKVNSSAWAILPEKLDAIYDILNRKTMGEEAFFQINMDRNDGDSYMQVNDDGIAVIQIMGTVGQRLNMLERSSGGVSVEILKKDLERAIENPDVKGILLHIDSPGGMVDGTRELAEFIEKAKEVMPVYAYTDGMMASAAYWIGAAANRVFAYPTAQVGSVGVVAMHIDYSKADEKEGIKRTYVYNGKYKRLINDTEPLSQEGREYMQEMVDQVYSIFVDDVARFRKVDAEHILGHESRMFLAAKASEERLVDDLRSFNQVYSILRKELKLMDLQELKTEFTGLYEEVKEIGVKEATVNLIAEFHPEKVEEWKEEGMKAERARISEIREAAFDGQEDLVDELIAEGAGVTEAIKKLNQDQKGKVQGTLLEIKGSDVGDLGLNIEGDKIVSEEGSADRRIAMRARELAKKEGIPLAVALKRVAKEDPELAKEALPNVHVIK